jgi:enoyl-CoA hydratase
MNDQPMPEHRESHVRVIADGSLVTLLIDRPEKANALTTDSLATISDALVGASADPSVRLVALRGTGTRVFCGGADLKEARLETVTAAQARRFDGLWDRVAGLFEKLPCTTVAAINGACLGGGLSLAAACDIRVASNSAYFSYPVAKNGFMPSPDDVKRLVTLIGPSRTHRLLVVGLEISAREALDIGLVDMVVAEAEMDDALSELRERIEQGRMLSQTVAKRLIRCAAHSKAFADDCYQAIYDGDESFAKKLMLRFIMD